MTILRLSHFVGIPSKVITRMRLLCLVAGLKKLASFSTSEKQNQMLLVFFARFEQIARNSDWILRLPFAPIVFGQGIVTMVRVITLVLLFRLSFENCSKGHFGNTIIIFVCPPKFCICIVSTFSWDLQWSQEKTKTTLMLKFWGSNKEYYHDGIFRNGLFEEFSQWRKHLNQNWWTWPCNHNIHLTRTNYNTDSTSFFQSRLHFGFLEFRSRVH